MIQITQEQRTKILATLLDHRANFSGTDAQYAMKHGINGAVYSRLKNSDKIDGLMSNAQWLNVGRELGVSFNERKWNMARTDVFTMIEEDVLFCKSYAKGRMCVDDCGIGKTYTAKYLSKQLNNCFYVDASQAKQKQAFVRAMAKAVGVDERDKYLRVKDNLKYALRMLPDPVIIIDEAGDLEYTAFLELKELWNATVGMCGWYLMGADGLRNKIERGINNKKVGFAEIFSRYSESYTTCVPTERHEKIAFYKKLITDVLSVNMNMKDKAKMNDIVKRCLTAENGNIGGLRRAESLLILNNS